MIEAAMLLLAVAFGLAFILGRVLRRMSHRYPVTAPALPAVDPPAEYSPDRDWRPDELRRQLAIETPEPMLSPEQIERGRKRLLSAIDATRLSDGKLLEDLVYAFERYWGIKAAEGTEAGVVADWLRTPRGRELAHRLERSE